MGASAYLYHLKNKIREYQYFSLQRHKPKKLICPNGYVANKAMTAQSAKQSYKGKNDYSSFSSISAIGS